MIKENKKMLVNVDDDETRIAAVTGNTLDNLHVEQTGTNRMIGNIYRGKVVKVQSSFQAAFVEYGAERHGFLAFSDVNFQVIKAADNPYSKSAIEKFLKPGQWVMVQVTRNQIGRKGASLTTHISLPGRFLVFMPNSNKGGVSKKIEDLETRARLKHLLEGLCGEKDSAIIRTAGVNRGASELKRDFMALRRKWNDILRKYESAAGPGLLYEEEDVVVRTLRDYFIDDIAEIWIDHPETFQRAREFFKANIPNRQKRLQFYLGERSLFSDYGIENQIEQLSSNHVPLPSGGSLVIDPTEALVAIDVNSGRYNQSHDIEETALRTNQEAAEEVARQLRLRNLGGLIVIDFVDMTGEENRNAVVRTMEERLQEDKAKWTLGTISQFGLLEMSRQRIANALSQEMKTTCPTCGGMGEVLSVSSLANAVLRKIRDLAATAVRGSGEIIEIHSLVPVELSNHLFNKKRQQLDELEVEFGIKIVLTADLSADPGKLPDFEVLNRTAGTLETDGGSGKKSLREEEKTPKDKEEKEKSGKNRRKKEKPAALSQPSESMEEAKTAVDPAEEPLDSNKDLPGEVEKPPKPVPLYSSAHQPGPAEQAGLAPPALPSAKANPPGENGKDVPPSTVLFSSSHRDSLQNRISPPPPAPPSRGGELIDRAPQVVEPVDHISAAGVAVSEPVNEPAAVEVPPAVPVAGEKAPAKRRGSTRRKPTPKKETAEPATPSEKKPKPKPRNAPKKAEDTAEKKDGSAAVTEKAGKKTAAETVKSKSRKKTAPLKAEPTATEKAAKKAQPTSAKKAAGTKTAKPGKAVRQSGKTTD